MSREENSIPQDPTEDQHYATSFTYGSELYSLPVLQQYIAVQPYSGETSLHSEPILQQYVAVQPYYLIEARPHICPPTYSLQPLIRIILIDFPDDFLPE
jgi:hypothetical protein